MNKIERQNFLKIIELAANCYKILYYFTVQKNLEQKEAAHMHLIQLHQALASSFSPFSIQIDKAIFESIKEDQDTVDEILLDLEKDVTRIDDNVNNLSPIELGSVMEIDLSNRLELLNYLNDCEEEKQNGDSNVGLLNYGDFVESSEKEENEIKKEVQRRVINGSPTIQHKKELSYTEIEKENEIIEAVEAILKLQKAIKYHKIIRNKNGKYS